MDIKQRTGYTHSVSLQIEHTLRLGWTTKVWASGRSQREANCIGWMGTMLLSIQFASRRTGNISRLDRRTKLCVSGTCQLGSNYISSTTTAQYSQSVSRQTGRKSSLQQKTVLCAFGIWPVSPSSGAGNVLLTSQYQSTPILCLLVAPMPSHCVLLCGDSVKQVTLLT